VIECLSKSRSYSDGNLLHGKQDETAKKGDGRGAAKHFGDCESSFIEG